MPQPISNKFYDLLRIHLETGINYNGMNFTDEQKKRVSVCIDTYKQFQVNPYLNISEYLKNRHHRTFSEIYNDRKVIDFIVSVWDIRDKNSSRSRVKRNAELAMKMGYDQGNADVMLKAGKQLIEIEELNKPEAGKDLEEDITKLPIAFTNDPRKLFPNKGYSTDEQMEKIRKKWGVNKDRKQELVERKIGEFISATPCSSIKAEEVSEVDDEEENYLEENSAHIEDKYNDYESE